MARITDRAYWAKQMGCMSLSVERGTQRAMHMVRRALQSKNGRGQTDLWDSEDLSHKFESGITLRVRSLSDWWVYNEVFVDGDYDPAIELFVGRTDSSVRPVILDLGANVGFFAARVIDRLLMDVPVARADLLLVEGSPSVFRELQARITDLKSETISITSVNALVGRREGAGTISEVDFGARNTMLPEHNAGITPISAMTHHRVHFVDLATLVGPTDRIDLLKCDIEGSEQTFLETYRSDLLERVDVAVFEFHHALCDVQACLRILSESGLRTVSSKDQDDATSLVVLVRG
jgi:FkbM family methyltransferase